MVRILGFKPCSARLDYQITVAKYAPRSAPYSVLGRSGNDLWTFRTKSSPLGERQTHRSARGQFNDGSMQEAWSDGENKLQEGRLRHLYRKRGWKEHPGLRRQGPTCTKAEIRARKRPPCEGLTFETKSIMENTIVVLRIFRERMFGKVLPAPDVSLFWLNIRNSHNVSLDTENVQSVQAHTSPEGIFPPILLTPKPGGQVQLDEQGGRRICSRLLEVLIAANSAYKLLGVLRSDSAGWPHLQRPLFDVA